MRMGLAPYDCTTVGAMFGHVHGGYEICSMFAYIAMFRDSARYDKLG